MEQIAAACGLAGGVTMECANSLNKMLDVSMRRLIKSCVQLAGESSIGDHKERGPDLCQVYEWSLAKQPFTHAECCWAYGGREK